MKTTLKIFGAAALAAGVSTALAAPVAVFDQFNDRTIDQERIGNDWTWYDTNYEADCTTYVGGFGPYSEGGGGYDNYVALNNNYERLDGGSGHDGTGYYRAGLAPQGGDDIALNVYQNQYATQPCNEIKIFKEFAGGDPGTYQINVNVIGNQYGDISEGSSVGLFFKVLDVDAGYSETQFEKYPITPPAYTASDLAVEVQFTVDDAASNRIVQVGMYAQHPNGGTASAIWDDFSIDSVALGDEVAEAVTGFAAEAGDGEVTLTWASSAARDGSGAPDAFIIQWKIASDPTWDGATEVAGTASSATIGGLTNETEYLFRIAARSGGTLSAWTTLSAAVAPAVPPAQPAAPATPVPVLPLWGLFGLLGLIGLLGARARRH